MSTEAKQKAFKELERRYKLQEESGEYTSETLVNKRRALGELHKRIYGEDIQSEPEQKQEEDPGFFSNIAKGAEYGKEDIKRQATILSDLMQDKVPEVHNVSESPELGWNRKSIGQFIGRNAVGALPMVSATAAGTGGGALAGTAVAPGIGTTIGGIAGGAAAGAPVSAGFTLADIYNEARQKGFSHKASIEMAKKGAKVSGALSLLGGGLGGIGIKGAITKYAAKQAGIQGAVSGADTVSQNLLAQKQLDPERELTHGLKESVIGTAAFQGVPVALATPSIINSQIKKRMSTPVKGTEGAEQVRAEAPMQDGDAQFTPPPEASEGQVIQPHEGGPDLKSKLEGMTEEPIDQAKIHEKIFGEKVEQTLMDKAKGVVNEMIERPMTKIDDALFNDLGIIKKMGKEYYALERDNPAYRKATFSRNMSGVMEAAYYHGTPTWDTETKTIGLNREKPGLFKLMEPVLKDEATINDFQDYAYARRVKSNDLIAKGKEKNLSNADVDFILDRSEFKPEFKETFDRIQEFKKSVLDVFEQSGMTNKEQREKWEGIDHIPFYRIKAKQDEKFKVRIGSKPELANQKSPIKELTGGKREYAVFDSEGEYVDRFFSKEEAIKNAEGINGSIEDVGPTTNNILENLAENSAALMQAAIRNSAANEALDLAIKSGAAERIKKAEAQKAGKNNDDVLKTKVGGEDAYFRVLDPILYNSLTSTTTPTYFNNKAITTLSYMKNLMSKSIVLTPTIQFGIGIKDLIQSRMMGQDAMPGMKQSLKNFSAALKHEMGKKIDPRIIDNMAMGASSTFFDSTPDKVLDRIMKDAIPKNAYVFKPIDLIKKPAQWTKDTFELIDKLGRAAELGVRLNKYDAALKAGASKEAAAFESLDYMNYKMRGSSDTVKLLGNVVPFLGTHLASINKAFMEMARKEPLSNKGLFNRALTKVPVIGKVANETFMRNRTMKAISAVSTFSILNAINNMRPDESEEDEANNYFSLPKTTRDTYLAMDLYKYFGKEAAQKVMGEKRFLMLPKPWFIGFMSMSLPEQMAYSMMDKGEPWSKFLLDNFAGQFSINPLGNPLMKVPIEQWANKQMFRDQKIVPESRKDLDPALQYGRKTGETAKAVGRAIGVSPARLEHAMTGLAGIAYTWPVMLTDMLLQNEKAEKKTSEQHFINRFVKETPLEHSGYESEFYEIYKEAETAYRTAKAYQEMGEVQYLEEYIKDKPGFKAKRDALAKISKNLKSMSNTIFKIEDDKTMTPKEKREQIDEINRQKNMMLFKVHQMKEELIVK